MNEDFVTYKQAVKLKELGFDWECNWFYHEGCHCGPMREGYNFNDEAFKKDISASTLAQAQKWLREEKKLILCIGHGSSIPAMYYWYINKSDGTIIDGDIESKDYDTYEQALSEGINRAIEFLKQQSNEIQN